MRKYFITILVILLSLPVLAQKKDFSRAEALQRRNNVTLTLGGNGLFLSVSYDRILVVKSNYFVDISAGIGIFPGIAGGNIPHQIVINKGKRTSFFMIGLGGTYEWHKTDESGFTKSVNSYNLVPIIGWKKFFGSHLLFSIYASPLIHISGINLYGGGYGYGVIPYAGVSFGFTF